METRALVSVIFVNYNTKEMLSRCLDSVRAHTKGVSYELIVVDNASSDGSKEFLKSTSPDLRLIESTRNLGFSAGNNLGAAEAQGRYLLFLNTDTILAEDAVSSLAFYMQSHPRAGAIGPRLLNQDGTAQLSYGALPSVLVELRDKLIYGLWGQSRKRGLKRLLAPRSTAPRDTGWVTGACLMLEAELFRILGGFDEEFFMYFEDKDLCRRIRNCGRSVVHHPGVRILHLLGGTSGREPPALVRQRYRQSQRHYYRKHTGKFQNLVLNIYLRVKGTP